MKLVSSPAVVTQVVAAVRHLCPFFDEHDFGHLTISWRADGQTIELHSLAAYLETFAEESISHEHLVCRVQKDVSELGLDDVRVLGEFLTAGMAVEVKA